MAANNETANEGIGGRGTNASIGIVLRSTALAAARWSFEGPWAEGGRWRNDFVTFGLTFNGNNSKISQKNSVFLAF